MSCMRFEHGGAVDWTGKESAGVFMLLPAPCVFCFIWRSVSRGFGGREPVVSRILFPRCFRACGRRPFIWGAHCCGASCDLTRGLAGQP